LFITVEQKGFRKARLCRDPTFCVKLLTEKERNVIWRHTCLEIKKKHLIVGKDRVN